MINFAIPDGHQMKHVLQFFDKIGFRFEGYQSDMLNRRPVLTVLTEDSKNIMDYPEKIFTKVIRPQDMPSHVAAGHFDVAITGTDWLREHKIRFPESPVTNLVSLGFGKVRLVAAIQEDLPVNNIEELKQYLTSNYPDRYFRIASEYAYIADHYALTNKLPRYQIIMTYGATESLIPEDAEMIIENTETGNTLRKNRLRILDTLFGSEGCLIVNANSLKHPEKALVIRKLEMIFCNYSGTKAQSNKGTKERHKNSKKA